MLPALRRCDFDTAIIAAMRETSIAHNTTVIDILKSTSMDDAPGVVAIARIPDPSGRDGINTTTDGKKPTLRSTDTDHLLSVLWPQPEDAPVCRRTRSMCWRRL